MIILNKLLYSINEQKFHFFNSFKFKFLSGFSKSNYFLHIIRINKQKILENREEN